MDEREEIFIPKSAQELEKERQQKITEYEKYIDVELKTALKDVLDQRDKIYDQISQYIELKNKLQLIQEQNLKEMKVMVNLGSDFFAKAKIPDTSKVFVNIGLGFHAEMTPSEAIEWIGLKEKQLNQKAETYTVRAAEIKARIKLIYQGLMELMGLNYSEEEMNRRDFH